MLHGRDSQHSSKTVLVTNLQNDTLTLHLKEQTLELKDSQQSRFPLP